MHAVFITNHYRVLAAIYNHTVTIGGETYCPLRQKEIATELGLSRIAVNKIFLELCEIGYLCKLARGKWKLTDEAVAFLHATS